MKRKVLIILAVLVSLSLGPGCGGGSGGGDASSQTSETVLVEAQPPFERLILVYLFPTPQVEQDAGADSISFPGLDMHKSAKPGLPLLPYKTAEVLIPYGRQFGGIEVQGKDLVELEGTYHIKHAQEPHSLDTSDPEPTSPDAEVYSSSDPYPAEVFSDLSIQRLRGYEILV
jgi:hypothetical protein